MEQKVINTKTVRQRLGGLITELQYTDNLFLIEKNGEVVGGLVSPKFLEESGVKLQTTSQTPPTPSTPSKPKATPEETPSKPKTTDGKAK